MELARKICAAALALAGPAFAQSTAFTYQGRLADAGAPASGPHDLRVRLFDAAAGGAQVGPTLCADNVPVADGVFSIQLDFGQQYATAGSRHLEVEVRADTGLGCADAGGFVTLAPRQTLTAAPMASHANAAFALDAPDGSPLNAVFVGNDGRVGVGLLAPQAPLHISTGNVEPAPGEGIRITGTSAGNTNVSYLSFGTTAGQAVGYVGDGSTSDSDMYLTSYLGDVFVYTPAGPVISATSGGSVGIGTTAPTAKLDVRGDIRLGTAAQHYAVKSPQNDRIIRGYVLANGTINTTQSSSGFSITKGSTGVYTINFSPAFTSPPTVVVGPTAQCCKPRLNGNAQTTQAFVHVNGVDAAYTLTDSPFTFVAIGQ